MRALHGDGGVIAVAPDGEMAWSFNTSGIFRARRAEGGKLEILYIRMSRKEDISLKQDKP